MSLFSGTLSAFLGRNVSVNSAPNAETLALVHDGIRWLQDNNFLIQRYGFSAHQVEDNRPVFPHAALSLPEVVQEWDRVEPAAPLLGHPDIVINPLEYDRSVQNEDHRYHRLPAGTAFTATDGRRGHQAREDGLPFTVPHGDPHLEALVFTTLNLYGKGCWQYTKRTVCVWFTLLINVRTELQEVGRRVRLQNRVCTLSLQTWC